MSSADPQVSGPTLWAAALVTRDDDLLMVRLGHGPAGGVWDVPRVPVRVGRTLAEAVVEALEEHAGMPDSLCGPFEGWQEIIGPPEGPHEVVMYFRAVVIADETDDTRARTPARTVGNGGTPAEVSWISVYQVPELATRDGLVEFLSDQSIIDTVV